MLWQVNIKTYDGSCKFARLHGALRLKLAACQRVPVKAVLMLFPSTGHSQIHFASFEYPSNDQIGFLLMYKHMYIYIYICDIML